MEFNDIKAMWEVYDKKINHLEVTNKHIINNLHSQKTTSFLNNFNYKLFLGLIAIPAIFTFVVWPIAKNNLDNTFAIIGIIAIAIVFFIQLLSNLFLLYQSFSLNLEEDPVLLVQKKIIKLKETGIQIHRIRNYTFPVLAGGFIFIFWTTIPFTLPLKTLFFCAFTISIYFWGSYKFKILFKNKISSLIKDLEELNTFYRD